MKKTLALILAVSLMLALLPAVQAADLNGSTGVLSYAIKDGEATITACDQNAEGTVVIPEKVENYPVTALGGDAFRWCNKVQKVVVPKSVKDMGNFTFKYCTSLTEINIPDGVTELKEHLFFGCEKLKELHIPDSVIRIGDDAFTETAVWDNPDYRRDEAVYIDHVLLGVLNGSEHFSVLPGTIAIAEKAFWNQEQIRNVTIPSSVKVIGRHAFMDCDLLETVTILNGVQSIDEFAFYCCKQLKTIEIPVSVKNIDKGAFLECRSLKDVYYSGTRAQWSKIDISDIQNQSLFDATIHCKQFSDVAPDAYYADAVTWAVEKGVTNGTGDTTFSPNQTCTRAQVVTFLWRANGSPSPKSNSNPFRDVSSGDYYYKAVLWAVEHGITTGTGPNSFSPDDGCTRAQVVTFLWRAKGSPKTSGSNPFHDVSASAYYYQAVLWAVRNGITNGTGEHTFSPADTCLRGQVVTFLYRAQK